MVFHEHKAHHVSCYTAFMKVPYILQGIHSREQKKCLYKENSVLTTLYLFLCCSLKSEFQ